MSLTPTDITSQRFKGAIFGFAKKEVRNFLEVAASELRALSRWKRILLSPASALFLAFSGHK